MNCVWQSKSSLRILELIVFVCDVCVCVCTCVWCVYDVIVCVHVYVCVCMCIHMHLHTQVHVNMSEVNVELISVSESYSWIPDQCLMLLFTCKSQSWHYDAVTITCIHILIHAWTSSILLIPVSVFNFAKVFVIVQDNTLTLVRYLYFFYLNYFACGSAFLMPSLSICTCTRQRASHNLPQNYLRYF